MKNGFCLDVGSHPEEEINGKISLLNYQEYGLGWRNSDCQEFGKKFKELISCGSNWEI